MQIILSEPKAQPEERTFLEENQNIFINNMQNDIGTIVEDNKLVIKRKKEIVEEVISTRLPNLEFISEKYYVEKLLIKRR